MMMMMMIIIIIIIIIIIYAQYNNQPHLPSVGYSEVKAYIVKDLLATGWKLERF